MGLPDFLILGAQKSGTTSLAKWMSEHPQVGMATPKELHFFDTHFNNGVKWYAAHFEQMSEASVRGEATPEYLYRPEAPRRIVETLGSDLRCIAVLRNPVDRAYSAYLHAQRVGMASGSFEEALDEEDRVLGQPSGHWGWAALVDRGRYLRQLQRYEKRLGRDSLHVFLFDDLADDPDGCLESTFAFLGVDPSVRIDTSTRYNVAQQSILPPSLRRLTRTKGRRAPIRERIASATTRRLEPPQMARATRSGLVAQLETEIRALGDWLGRDLTHWLS